MMKIFEISKENLDIDAFEMILNIGSFVGETQADNLVKFVEGLFFYDIKIVDVY